MPWATSTDLGILVFLGYLSVGCALDMLRRSPRNHKNPQEGKPLKAGPPSQCLASGPAADVKKDFRPLLWQNSIRELSAKEISFPTPQPVLDTTLFNKGPRSACPHYGIASGGSWASVFVNWKAALRR